MRTGFAISLAPAIAVVGTYLLDLRAITALLLVAVVPLVIAAAIVLVRAALEAPLLVALRASAVWSLTAALMVTGIGIVALNSMLQILPRDVVGLLFVTVLAIPSVPATFSLYLYVVRKF